MAVVLSLLAGCSDNSGAGGVAAKADKHPGEETYNRFCSSCHASGVAGAPKFGDVEAWASRLAKGRELVEGHRGRGHLRDVFARRATLFGPFAPVRFDALAVKLAGENHKPVPKPCRLPLGQRPLALPGAARADA